MIINECFKIVIAFIVSDALHNIADIFGVKEANRQFHQFGQEIGNQRNADSCVGMQVNPM